MAKFSIAFIAPDEQKQLRHRIIESPAKDAALITFFVKELSDFYSDDEKGFFYFRNDFFDPAVKCGSIIELE